MIWTLNSNNSRSKKVMMQAQLLVMALTQQSTRAGKSLVETLKLMDKSQKMLVKADGKQESRSITKILASQRLMRSKLTSTEAPWKASTALFC